MFPIQPNSVPPAARSLQTKLSRLPRPNPSRSRSISPSSPFIRPRLPDNPAALKVSQFFWLDFLTGIPLVGFILTLVWGFGGDVNENKRNYCRAKLVWLLIGIAVTVIFTIIAVAGGGLAALIYEQY